MATPSRSRPRGRGPRAPTGSRPGALVALDRRLDRLVAPPQPAERAADLGRRLHLALHPAARGEPAMRHHARARERALLVLGGQAEPEVAVLRAEGKAREELRTDEVAPAAEHRGDLDARPAREHLVELAGGAGAALPEA